MQCLLSVHYIGLAASSIGLNIIYLQYIAIYNNVVPGVDEMLACEPFSVLPVPQPSPLLN